MAKNAFGKGCALGCGGVALVVILLMVIGHFALKNMTPEQRAALHADADATFAEQKAAEDKSIDAFLDRLRDLGTRLPGAAEIKEQIVANFPGDRAAYLPVDAGFFGQFTPQGFVPAASPEPPPFYRAQLIRNIQGALTVSKDRPRRDNGALLLIKQEFEHAPYLMVVLPTEQRWPTLNADGKTFRSGFFQGWAVLVDGKTLQPLGQTAFTVQNSEKVTSLRVGLGDRLVGNDLKTAIENDFVERFWTAADQAVAHVYKHDGTAGFASHEDHFATGG